MTLLSHGVAHNIAEIGRLTSRQISLLYVAALRIESRERAERIQDVNAGTHGGEQADRLMSRLLGPDEEDG